MQKLTPNNFYHIYNRGNNGELIFYRECNYRFFLKKLDYHLTEFLDVFAFALMPNHFHLLVKVKPLKNLSGLKDLTGLNQLTVVNYISKRFSNFFNAYSKAINKQQNRHGSLFERPFKRKIINNEKYLQHLIYYIHNNPLHHGFVEKMEDWTYSSYNLILNNKKSKLCKKEVLDCFSGKEGYRKFHKEEQSSMKINDWLFD